MFALTLEKPLKDFHLGELQFKIGYHMKRAYECFTYRAKHEHIRIADMYAGEVAERTNFHSDCMEPVVFYENPVK